MSGASILVRQGSSPPPLFLCTKCTLGEGARQPCLLEAIHTGRPRKERLTYAFSTSKYTKKLVVRKVSTKIKDFHYYYVHILYIERHYVYWKRTYPHMANSRTTSNYIVLVRIWDSPFLHTLYIGVPITSKARFSSRPPPPPLSRVTLNNWRHWTRLSLPAASVVCGGLLLPTRYGGLC